MNRLIFFVVILSLNCVLFAQNNYEKEYKTVIPGAEYQAGSFHRFLFGDHWRELWTSPVTVEVLNLEKFGGGLIPIKKGGGMQTKSLRFQGGDGLIWKFRSINKDPSKILPEILRETIADDLLQDQISSSNPMAPLIAAPLLNAVGVLQAEPYLVYLPDDPKLGEFREDFGGMLGMIEIHPDESDDENDPGFAGADKVMGTFKLFHRLEDKRDEWVDAPSFLKARLMDILLGDWDRHTDQWRWARYDYGKNEIWYPVPRDRDQALAKFDGLFPMAAEYMVPQLVHFDYT
ncbi:MAG: hypothetical protein K9J16_16170, partial [Melioribacteraceae bacterium]|nr:hypothetical protein [Melioribacteraceae bacterium]